MSVVQPLAVKAVDSSTWADFDALFRSKGAPSYCWCMAWRMTKEELKKNTSPNRKKFIRKRVQAGIPIGLLGYVDAKPVAWCSIAPRDTYERLGGDESLTPTWSIACFFIKKEYRDRGYVDILVHHAKKYAKSNGAKFLEAYPVEPSSPSYRFMGFKQTFAKAKFKFLRMAGTRRHVMVHKL